MSRTLRINGNIADLDSETKINLSYKSPIFGDLQKLSANTSLTIKLRATANNRALTGNVNIVGVNSGMAYDYFRVDYLVDGLTLIDNGQGYLLSVNEQTIELSVIFGGVSGFAKLKDAKLNEMPIPVEQGQIMWDGAQFANYDTQADVMFLDMDFGLGVPATIQYAHPVVKVSKIIDWINTAYDMQLAPLGDGLVVPCVTKNRREGYGSPYIFMAAYKIGLTTYDGFYGLWAPEDQSMDRLAGSFQLKFNGGDISYPEEATFRFEARYARGGVWTEITKIFVAGEWYEREINSDKPLEVTVPANTRFSVIVDPQIGYDGKFLSNFKMTLSLVDDSLTRYEKFDTLYNLPTIKVADFIKALIQLQGVFPALSPTGGIGWVSVDDLYNNIPKARNWSDKLCDVKSIGFRVDGYAQNNFFVWAEDDTVSPASQQNVAIVVENKTLEVKKEMVKLPFAASDINTISPYYPYAIVPIYTKKSEEDGTETIEYSDVKPRILRAIAGMRGMFLGTFDLPLYGERGIVATKYAKYQEVVRQPKTVKAELLLSARDISELDLMIPVYIEQLEGYFALLNVVTKEHTSEVEMLRL